MSRKVTNCGLWKKPRTNVYDYNEKLGSNYYQPMIDYIHTKNIQGVFFDKKPVQMAERAEVYSEKFNKNFYYDNLNFDINRFLTKAYAKQIRELNESTARAQYEILRNSKSNTKFVPDPPMKMIRDHYVRELYCIKFKAYPEPIYFRY